MAADNALRNGAVGVALLATAGLVAGIVTVSRPQADRSHIVVPFGDGGKPQGARCLAVTVRASPQALALYGLTADAGEQYAHVIVAALPSDGTAALPSGFDSVPDTEVEVPCVAPAGAIEARIGSGAGHACACGPALIETVYGLPGQPPTTRPWVPGSVIAAGRWAPPDAGSWARHPCVALAGSPVPVPEECK